MRRVVFLWFGILGILSCNDRHTNDNSQSFDRGALLIHYADQHIQPAFDSLSEAATLLEQEWNQLPEEFGLTELVPLKESWTRVFHHFQVASIFNLGPAAEQGLRKSLSQELGTFPISPEKTTAYLLKTDTSFNNFDRDTRGIFAIEYFLFGGSDTNAVNQISNSLVRAYLGALIRHTTREAQRVAREWREYRNMFTKQTATDAGSSTVQLYNSFLLAYEGLKNFKLGVPLGLRMGQTQMEPDKVEARYSGLGRSGLQLQMRAIENVWRGSGNNGFRAYLLASTGGSDLVEATEKQLALIQAKIDLIPKQPLQDLVRNQHPSLLELHTELQRNTRFFKSDMSSILGLSITYSSGDGD